VNEHLSDERLVELLREAGPEFSKEELEHLTECQECGIALVAVRESISSNGDD
jgi:hypothetical protein